MLFVISQAFGTSIEKLQLIQAKIAEMAVRLEQSRLLIYKAAALKDAGRPITKEAAMAKLSASETATFVAHQAIQVIITYNFASTSDNILMRVFSIICITQRIVIL